MLRVGKVLRGQILEFGVVVSCHLYFGGAIERACVGPRGATMFDIMIRHDVGANDVEGVDAKMGNCSSCLAYVNIYVHGTRRNKRRGRSSRMLSETEH